MSAFDYIRNYGYAVYTANGRGIFRVQPDENIARREAWVQIEAQTVADYVALQHFGHERDTLVDMFAGLKLTPPYPHVIFHYERDLYDHHGTVDSEVKTRGSLITILTTKHITELDDTSAKAELLDEFPETTWVLGVEVIIVHAQGAAARIPTLVPYTLNFLLNESGELFQEVGGFSCATPEPWMAAGWSSNVASEAMTVLHACAFLHVKDAAVVEDKPTRAAVRKAERKGKPLIRHHRLVVKPLETHMRRVREHVARHGSGKALHMVRGHFATYTEDKPMLGHYVGTVWRAPHWRGDTAEGIVTKDYKVDIS